MNQVDIRFVVTGILFALVGMTFGIWIGINQAFEHAHLHAHINLVGWVTLILFGLAYRTYPAAGRSRLARIHYWVALVGALLFLPGIPIAQFEEVLGPVVIGSLLTLASMALFFVNMLRNARASS